ncbi:MAG: RNA polymerase sigma factor [Archangium sp.]|nr:RNA polymerase sigma factor [Archangium sp.]
MEGNGEATTSDEELFLRFRERRDTAAFEVLYDRYETRLSSFAARMVGRGSVADDVLQETWIRVLKHVREWRPEAPLRTWLFRIARNLCLDYLKSKGVQLDAAGEPEPVSTRDDTDAGAWVYPASDPLFIEIAEQAVLQLTPAQREVVLMRVDGMSFTEISQATSVTANTLKSRMNEARKRIEAWLQARGYDGHA